MSTFEGIALTEADSKVYRLILLGRIRPVVEPKLLDSACAYRRGRGAADSQFLMRRVIELATAAGQTVWPVFVDFRRAFDSLDREVLWAALRAYGVDPVVVDRVADLYADSGCRVRVNGTTSERFQPHAGVQQGCPLSPTLFNVYMDLVIRDFLSACTSAGIHGIEFSYKLPGRDEQRRHLFEVTFADDLALTLASSTQAQQALSILKGVAVRWGLILNWDKTVVVQMQPPSIPRVGPAESLTLDSGEEVKVVGSTKYIGLRVNDHGDQMEEIRRRISSASFAFHKWSRILVDKRKRSAPCIKARTNLYKCYVLPALMYGGPEAWALPQDKLNGVAAIHNAFLRRILGRYRSGPGGAFLISNADLHRLTGARPLPSHLDELRLRRLGHIARMPDSCLVKQILFANKLVGFPNLVGGPRRKWMDLANISLRHLQIEHTWYDIALDRAGWSTICSTV